MAVAMQEAASSPSLTSSSTVTSSNLIATITALHGGAEQRIDDSPCPSVGLKAAALLGDADERETWRSTARDWYAMGLKDTPGTGRLQHHLGTLCRDVKGDEMRAFYHFSKRYLFHSFFLSSKMETDRALIF